MARLSREAQKDVDRLYRNWVTNLPKAIKAEVAPVVKSTAEEISSFQARNAPVSQDKTPGQLRASHHVEISEDGFKATMIAGGEAAPHALHVELGTQKMAAEPWFFPAFRLMKTSARSKLRRAFNKAIKRLERG